MSGSSQAHDTCQGGAASHGLFEGASCRNETPEVSGAASALALDPTPPLPTARHSPAHRSCCRVPPVDIHGQNSGTLTAGSHVPTDLLPQSCQSHNEANVSRCAAVVLAPLTPCRSGSCGTASRIEAPNCERPRSWA